MSVALKLEDIKVGLLVTGIVPGYVARIVSVESAGSDAVTVIVKSDLGVAEQQLFRSDRHIEVKGRVKGATDVIMTCNEISYAVNQGDKFILALVLVDDDKTEGPYYIRNIWQNELNFGVEHEAYKIADLMTKAEKPEETLT